MQNFSVFFGEGRSCISNLCPAHSPLMSGSTAHCTSQACWALQVCLVINFNLPTTMSGTSIELADRVDTVERCAQTSFYRLMLAPSRCDPPHTYCSLHRACWAGSLLQVLNDSRLYVLCTYGQGRACGTGLAFATACQICTIGLSWPGMLGHSCNSCHRGLTGCFPGPCCVIRYAPQPVASLLFTSHCLCKNLQITSSTSWWHLKYDL